jgi:hypothetical protein
MAEYLLSDGRFRIMPIGQAFYACLLCGYSVNYDPAKVPLQDAILHQCPLPR